MAKQEWEAGRQQQFISGFDSCTENLTASICIVLLTGIAFPRQK